MSISATRLASWLLDFDDDYQVSVGGMLECPVLRVTDGDETYEMLMVEPPDAEVAREPFSPGILSLDDFNATEDAWVNLFASHQAAIWRDRIPLTPQNPIERFED